ncbi:MAG TPA: amidohydrolase family protein [Cryomorphaceae bacterium]|nr:amidohydrolase family protein [Cryomorphaceae bacterium]
MRLRFILVSAALFMLLATVHSQTTFPEDGRSEKDAIYHLFTGGTVHITPGTTDTSSFLVHKGQILAIGERSEMEIPENTLVHDISGQHVFPSFIELNSDYGVNAIEKRENKRGPEYGRKANTATSWNDAIHPEINAVERFSPDTDTAIKYRKMGFGIVLAQLKDGIARGTSTLALTGEGEANELVEKSQVAGHYSFEKGSSVQDYPSSLMGAIALLRQSFYDAEWYATTEADEINFSMEALNSQRELPRFFEAKDKLDLNRIAKIAREFKQEYVFIGDGRTYQLDLTNAGEISAIVAPLKFPDPYDMSDPDLSRYIDQGEMMHWETAPFNPFFIQESGITLALSAAGVKKPESFFQALHKAIGCGLNRDSAFAALTTVPARLIGMGGAIGEIRAGQPAHFFIASADVFSDEDAKIYTHWIAGKPYVIQNPNEISLDGKYNINVNDTYFKLQVEGEKKYKAKVSYIANKDTTLLKATLVQQANEVTLKFEAPDSSGYYRLSGTVLSDNRIWNGRGILPNGDMANWSAIYQIPDDEAANKTDSLLRDSIPKPPARPTPFGAFGFDSLPRAETVLFKNATIWTNEAEGVLENASLLISGGIIRGVGKSLKIDELLTKAERESLVVVDVKGRHITPGIIDEHSHIAISRGVNEGTQTSTAEVRIGDAINPDDINIYRQLSGGVTTSQLLHGSANPIGGQSAIIKLRWGRSADEMKFAEAPGFIKFALGENVKQSNWGSAYTERFPQTRMGVEQVFYEYFYRAKEYGERKRLEEARIAGEKNKRSWFKKPKEPKRLMRKDIELEAILEILNRERYITCHSYVQSEINMLMHVADSMGFTLNTFTHILEGYKVADKMAEHGANGSTFSDWWAYKFEVNDAIPYNAAIMHKMGVNVAINSDDAEMGRRLNQEAAKSIKYGGLSEEEALKMVTLNPAKMMHIDDYVGSLAAGKHADLVIWSYNPLSVYAVAEQTYVDGAKYFDRETDKTLRKRDSANRARIAKSMEDAKEAGAKTRKPNRKVERMYHCDTMD